MEAEARTDGVRLRRGRISLKFRFRLRRFRTRILFFFLGLLSLVLVSVFAAVNAANMRNAHTKIEEDLEVANRVFIRLIRFRVQRLADGAYLLSNDFAFKQAIATDDHPTILSALDNLKARISADVITLVSVDYALIADTMHPETKGKDFFLPEIIKTAEDQGQAFTIAFIEDRAYQMVVTPVLAPEPIAWLCISFVIDEPLLRELQRITLSHISLFRVQGGDNLFSIASTLPPDLNRELLERLPKARWDIEKSILLKLNGRNYVTIVASIFKSDQFTVLAVLQRSMEEALKLYYRLRTTIIALSAMALVISLVGGVFIARTVSKPVLTLVDGAREIERGNYEYSVAVNQQDEIGELASAFNKMTCGLAERDKVRNLLGKVVSADVATELLKSKEVRLGGEERTMTALFSDIAGFTSISEKMEPTGLVELLNEYLSAMTEHIYEFGGTVDKFIGDAIVAFWGAPLPEENHAELCVRAAIMMQKRLAELRSVWRKQGKMEFSMRIGINTGKMVVGNMGSKDRLDYTIIGDAVNLTGRLEGANKYYGTGIIISEFTYLWIKEKFLFRELDIVRVEGKEEAIRVFEVIDEIERVSENQRNFVLFFEEAVEAFRRLDFEKAEKLFERCKKLSQNGDKASELYMQRITKLVLTPPSEDWDKVYPLAK